MFFNSVPSLNTKIPKKKKKISYRVGLLFLIGLQVPAVPGTNLLKTLPRDPVLYSNSESLPCRGTKRAGYLPRVRVQVELVSVATFLGFPIRIFVRLSYSLSITYIFRSLPIRLVNFCAHRLLNRLFARLCFSENFCSAVRHIVAENEVLQ